MSNLIFYGIAGIIAASAVLVVSARNLFHCALFLALTMFSVSGVFLYLNAEFLAAVQVLIYVGAVTVLLIFGIMLTRKVMDENAQVFNNQVGLSLVTALAVLVVLFKVISHSPFQMNDHPTALTASVTAAAPGAAVETAPAPASADDVYSLGSELLRPEKGFAFAFEFISILLLSALVGALVVARKDPA